MSEILEDGQCLFFTKGCIECLLCTLILVGTLTSFSLTKLLNTTYLRYTHVGKYLPKRNVQYINDISLIKLYITLQRMTQLPFILFNKNLPYAVEYSEVETPRPFFKCKKIQCLLPLPFMSCLFSCIWQDKQNYIL